MKNSTPNSAWISEHYQNTLKLWSAKTKITRQRIFTVGLGITPKFLFKIYFDKNTNNIQPGTYFSVFVLDLSVSINFKNGSVYGFEEQVSEITQVSGNSYG